MKLAFALIIFVLATASVPAAVAHDDVAMTLGAEVFSVPVGPYAYCLEDPSGALSFERVTAPPAAKSFIRNERSVPAWGFTRSAFWLRFSFVADANAPRDWVLELSYPLMDFIELYVPDERGSYRRIDAGYRYPFSQRGNGHPLFVFSLSVKPGARGTAYLRLAGGDRIEAPLTLWRADAFHDKTINEQYVLGMYYGLMLVIVIFNLIMFISVRDRAYLRYVFFIVAIGFYQLTQDGLAYKFLPAGITPFNHYIIASIAAIEVFAILFTQSYLNTATMVPRLHRALFVVLMVPVCIFAASFVLDYTTSIQLIVITTLISIGLALFVGVRVLLANYRPARFFMAAWGFTLTGAAISSLKNLGVLPANFFTIYSLHIGTAIELIILTIGLGDRITILRREKDAAQAEKLDAQRIMVESLMQSHRELEDAFRELARTEERYRRLVEDSSDIIFTLDNAGTVLSINRAIERHFSVSPDMVIGMHFQTLLFRGGGPTDSNRFVIEKLEQFLRDRETAQFKAEFRSPIVSEPKEMLVQLESLDFSGREEIRGTASPITEDTLLSALVEDRQTYRIGNYLLAAEDVSHRITRNLRRYEDQHTTTMLRVALREMIINAIEHGNLGISYDEKTRAITEGAYFEFVSARQADPRFRDRTVTIEYHITSDGCRYTVTDEGDGFDHRARMSVSVAELNSRREIHGRGILMATSFFDAISYNETGNAVTLVKRFRGGRP